MAHWQVNRNTATEPKLEFIQNKISVMTQACHAATAILHITREDKNTQEYLADLDNMHKVVLEVIKVQFFLVSILIQKKKIDKERRQFR
jgi:hypothetical protein